MTDEQKDELREKQWELAMNGNVKMLVWLGKQYLKQRDIPDPMQDWDRPFDKIVYKECDSKCNCVDCGKGVGIKMEGLD